KFSVGRAGKEFVQRPGEALQDLTNDIGFPFAEQLSHSGQHLQLCSFDIDFNQVHLTDVEPSAVCIKPHGLDGQRARLVSEPFNQRPIGPCPVFWKEKTCLSIRVTERQRRNTYMRKLVLVHITIQPAIYFRIWLKGMNRAASSKMRCSQ